MIANLFVSLLFVGLSWIWMFVLGPKVDLRGLYVDENAIITRYSSVGKISMEVEGLFEYGILGYNASVGYLRAPSGDGTQSILLGFVNGSEVAEKVLLELAKTTIWLDKDVVLLDIPFVDSHVLKEIDTWLNGYPSLVRQALILDMNGFELGPSVFIDPVGAYGLLPNMDLLSTTCGVLNSVGLSWDLCYTPTVGLSTTMRCFIHHLLGSKDNVHSVFQGHGIDAITLNTLDSLESRLLIDVSIRFIESFNGLSEKLHHSTFYYWFISKNTFLPMGMTVVPLVIGILAMVFLGLHKIYVVKWMFPHWGQVCLFYLSVHCILFLGVKATELLPLVVVVMCVCVLLATIGRRMSMLGERWHTLFLLNMCGAVCLCTPLGFMNISFGLLVISLCVTQSYLFINTSSILQLSVVLVLLLMINPIWLGYMLHNVGLCEEYLFIFLQIVGAHYFITVFLLIKCNVSQLVK